MSTRPTPLTIETTMSLQKKLKKLQKEMQLVLKIIDRALQQQRLNKVVSHYE